MKKCSFKHRFAFTIGLCTIPFWLGACGGGSASSTPSPPPVVTAPTPPPFQELPPPEAAPAGPDYHPSDKGWVQVWGDEFDGDTLDPTKWAAEVSCWGGGNNERQCYTERTRNVEVVNGLLRLVAYPETFTGPEFAQDRSNRGGQITQNYTSGKVRSLGLADWTYGRFEARIKLPTGQGTWPAFWMMPADDVYGGWPLSGEIDIMEAVNLGAACSNCEGSTTENHSSGTLHFGSEFPNNTFKGEENTLPGAIDDYYVFAAEWGEGRINWFVNDTHFQSQDISDWFTDTVSKDENPNAPFDQSFYVMLNNAVGGNYPENTNERRFEEGSFPNQMLIDWVRVYQCEFDGTTGTACMADAINN